MLYYRLETYTTDDVIAKIMRSMPPIKITTMEHSELLWARVLRCDLKHREYVLKATLQEGYKTPLVRQCARI